MLCELCYDDEFFPSNKVVTEVSVDDLVALSNGFFYPSFRRALFLCRPCVERVQATGEILARWKGKLDVVFPRNQQSCWDKCSNNNGGCRNNGSNNYSSNNNDNNSVRSGDDSMYVQGMLEQTPSCPPLKSASHDSGITYDSDCIGEYFEAEDVSRPSTAFASAEEDEAEKSSSPTSGGDSSPYQSFANVLPSTQVSPPPTMESSLGAISAEIPSSSGSTPAYFPSFYSSSSSPPLPFSSPSSFAGFSMPPSVRPRPTFTPPPPPPPPFAVSPAAAAGFHSFDRAPAFPFDGPMTTTTLTTSMPSVMSASTMALIGAMTASSFTGSAAATKLSAIPPSQQVTPVPRGCSTTARRGPDPKNSLFSLKEFQLALATPMERKCQLQPATLPVDNSSGFKIPRPRPIQKSVADQDPDVGCSEDVDEQPADLADFSSSSASFHASQLQLRPSSLSSSRRGCGFCLSNGERQRECMSHRLKNPDTLIVECPQLRKFVCPLCKATGDFAHTQGYCPLNEADIPTVKHLKKKRSSAGRLAGGKNLRPELLGLNSADIMALDVGLGYGGVAGCGLGGVAGCGLGGVNGSLGVVDPSIIAVGPKGGN